MGPTLISYLRGVGAGVAGIVEATTAAAAASMAGNWVEGLAHLMFINGC